MKAGKFEATANVPLGDYDIETYMGDAPLFGSYCEAQCRITIEPDPSSDDGWKVANVDVLALEDYDFAWRDYADYVERARQILDEELVLDDVVKNAAFSAKFGQNPSDIQPGDELPD